MTLINGDDAVQPQGGHWGALELAVRCNVLTMDKDTFPTYSDASKSANKAQAFAAVANWHWNKNLKLSVSFEHAAFDGGAAGGADRASEKAIFQRIQAAF